MKRLGILIIAATLLVTLAGIARPAEAGTYHGGLPTIDCTGINFTGSNSIDFDRDNTGSGAEFLEMIAYDGNCTEIFHATDTRTIPDNTGFTPVYPWTATPDYNPITVRMISPAGGKVGEQIVWETTGECAGLPSASVAGCDVTIPLTATSVVGAFVADAPTSWTPGQLTSPLVTIPAGKTAWVLGQDASGDYYKIVWVCDLLWVPTSTLGPNYDATWNGRPLPTGVVN